MFIRKTTSEDLPAVLSVYEKAREFMRTHGNPNQWGNSNPDISLILHDIEVGDGYVLIEDGEVVGAFAFILGEDPTYGKIDGAWHYSLPYGTIHRLASSGKCRGIADCCFRFCEAKIPHLRIDTHECNLPMQKAVGKFGFSYAGIIYLLNGDPRLAYDYYKKEK